MIKNIYITTGLILFALPLFAAPALNFKPAGIAGSAGAGFAVYRITTPATNFKLDQGVYAALSGEKGFGALNLYLTISFGYLSTKGQTNYDYTSLAGVHYAKTDVNFDTAQFQAALGLKLKIIDGYWIRPYAEGGGLGEYYQIKYTTDLTGSGPAGDTNFKKEDTLFNAGQYAEGGLEVSFSSSFGIKAAGRFITAETKPFDTLSNQTIKYVAEIYYFSLLKAF